MDCCRPVPTERKKTIVCKVCQWWRQHLHKLHEGDRGCKMNEPGRAQRIAVYEARAALKAPLFG